MLASMSSRQLREWMEWARLEPFGELHADLRAGIIAATIANCQRARTQQPLGPQDFMPWLGPKRSRQRKTLDELKEAVLSMGLKMKKRS